MEGFSDIQKLKNAEEIKNPISHRQNPSNIKKIIESFSNYTNLKKISTNSINTQRNDNHNNLIIDVDNLTERNFYPQTTRENNLKPPLSKTSKNNKNKVNFIKDKKFFVDILIKEDLEDTEYSIYDAKLVKNNKSKNIIKNQTTPLSLENQVFIPKKSDKEFLFYKTQLYIEKFYPHIKEINQKNNNLHNILGESTKFFVIKSFSEEDIHKSIKYGIWTSSKIGNNLLEKAFETSNDVILFFSVNQSGKFIGFAKIKSKVIKKNFPFWFQVKFNDLFLVEWLVIKDIPFNTVKHIEFTLRDGEMASIIFSRDTQEIPFKDGLEFIKIFNEFFSLGSILENFQIYDKKQEEFALKNSIKDFNLIIN